MHNKVTVSETGNCRLSTRGR